MLSCYKDSQLYLRSFVDDYEVARFILEDAADGIDIERMVYLVTESEHKYSRMRHCPESMSAVK